MKLFTLTALTAMALGTGSFADTIETSTVITHPSQGDKTVVAGATARLMRHEDGVFVNFETSGLTPGNVNTLWFVVINDPAQCETPFACVTKDVLKRSDIVKSDVKYGGGLVVGPDGSAEFAWHQSEGPFEGGWFADGLMEADDAEIHLVINDHGPLIDGREFEMLNSYRDGCTDDSIPGPMPATARVQGEAGPNTCRLMQFSIFRAPGASS